MLDALTALATDASVTAYRAAGRLPPSGLTRIGRKLRNARAKLAGQPTDLINRSR
jgi:hypothetical protein